MYSELMGKKRCIICTKDSTPERVTCSDECSEALVFKQRSLDRHRGRSKVPGTFRVTVADWMRILKAYNHCCAYCGISGSMTIDHVLPLSRGGRHCIGNLVPACLRCNTSKGNLTVVEWRADPLKKVKSISPQQCIPWTVDERMGIRPVRKKYKPKQSPIFSQMMKESYEKHIIDNLNLTVDHFGVLL